ncbi:MAG: hypothetical protein HYS80_01135 [Candidatus Aenigmarchaeota archaeon]|nr:hypothetical protein [Candidatus Aenigmarchaeota archaeon]
MKAVSLIIQFVIFFTIGFGFFLLAGNLFKFQSGLVKQDILDASSKLAASQMSASSITAVDSCKSCDNTTIKINSKTIVGYAPTYQLSNGIILKIEPESKLVQSSMHNLYRSISYGSAEVSSSKTIALTYDRTKNNLVIE